MKLSSGRIHSAIFIATFLSCLNARADDIPPRSADEAYSRHSDEQLWALLKDGGYIANVGLKEPGTARGFWKGKRLIGASTQNEAEVALAHAAGAILIKRDTSLPMIYVKFENAEALGRARSSPFVDYISPAEVEYFLASDSSSGSTGSSSGCLNDVWGQAGKNNDGFRPSDEMRTLLPLGTTWCHGITIDT